MENENLHNNPDLVWDQEEIKTQELIEEMGVDYDDVSELLDTIHCFGDLINAAGLSPIEPSQKSLYISGTILCDTFDEITSMMDVNNPDNLHKNHGQILSCLEVVKTYGELLISAGTSETVITQKTLQTAGNELMHQADVLEKLFN